MSSIFVDFETYATLLCCKALVLSSFMPWWHSCVLLYQRVIVPQLHQELMLLMLMYTSGTAHTYMPKYTTFDPCKHMPHATL